MIVPHEKRHLHTLIYIDIFNMNIHVYEYEIDPKPFVDNFLYIVID